MTLEQRRGGRLLSEVSTRTVLLVVLGTVLELASNQLSTVVAGYGDNVISLVGTSLLAAAAVSVVIDFGHLGAATWFMVGAAVLVVASKVLEVVLAVGLPEQLPAMDGMSTGIRLLRHNLFTLGLVTMLVALFSAIHQAHAARRRLTERNEALQREMAERIDAERTVRAEQEFATAILSNSYDGIAVVNARREVELLSEGMERILAAGRDEMPTLEALVEKTGLVPEDEGDFLELWDEPNALHRHWECGVALRRMDGRVRHCSLRIAPMGDGRHVINGHDVTEARATQEALRESERRFRQLTESVPVGVYQFRVSRDSTRSFTYISDKIEDVAGTPVEEILRDYSTLHSGIHADHVQAFEEAMRVSAAELTLFHREFEYVRRDGVVVWLEARAMPTQNSDGDTVWNGVFADITERKRAEEALRQAEQRLASVMDAQQEMVCRFLPDTTLTFVNQAYCRYFGMTEEELTGTEFLKLLPEAQHEPVLEGIGSLCALRPSQTYQHPSVLKDGTQVWQEWTDQVILDSNGRVIEYQSTGRDITARKRAEEELTRTRTLLEQTFEQSPYPMVLVSMPDAVVEIANPAIREFLGIEDNPNPTGQPLFAMEKDWKDCDPDGNEMPIEDLPLSRALQGHSTLDGEIMVVRKDGTVRFELVSAVPIRDAHGQVLAGYLVCADITERKRMEEALRESEERYRLLFEASRDAMMTMAPPAWRFTSGNAAACELFGARDEAEFITLGPWDVSPEQQPGGGRSRDEAQGKMREALRDGSRFFEWTHKRLDGTEFSATVQLTRMEMGGEVSLHAIVRDITARKQAEEELTRTRTLLEQAFEQSPYPMVLASAPGAVLRIVNPAIREFLGITDEPSPVGQSLFDMEMTWKDCDLEGNDLPLEALPLPRALRGEKTLDQEVMAVTKDGVTRHELVSGVPIYDENGQVMAGYLVCVDITERKHMEEMLRESEERFRLQYINTPLPTGTWRREGDQFILVDCNQRAIAHSRGNILNYLGKPIEALFGSRPAILEAVEECFREKAVVDLETPFNPPDREAGVLEELLFTMVPVPPDLVMMHVENVTERRRAEREAAVRDRYLTCLTDISTELLAEHDVFETLPRVAERLREVAGADRCFFVDLEDGEVRQQCEACAPGIAPKHGTTGACPVDWRALGLGRWLECLGSGAAIVGPREAFPAEEAAAMARFGVAYTLVLPLHARGSGVGFVGFELCGSGGGWSEQQAALLRVAANAISAAYERKHTEDIIAEQRASIAASARLSSLGEMASGVAHEINNPLAVISAAGEHLARMADTDSLDEAMLTALVEKIGRNALRIKRIIRGLRNLSRDGSEDPCRAASLRLIVDDCLELCLQRFRAHGVRLETPRIPDTLALECQATQISEVCLNLLSNAFDAACQQDDPWVRLEVRDDGDWVELAVVDSGAGIPQALSGRVFEPFWTTKGSGKGTGLGLSLSRRIVDRHRGQLFLDEANEHTRFVVRLPKRQNAFAADGLAE